MLGPSGMCCAGSDTPRFDIPSSNDGFIAMVASTIESGSDSEIGSELDMLSERCTRDGDETWPEKDMLLARRSLLVLPEPPDPDPEPDPDAEDGSRNALNGSDVGSRESCSGDPSSPACCSCDGENSPGDGPSNCASRSSRMRTWSSSVWMVTR